MCRVSLFLPRESQCPRASPTDTCLFTRALKSPSLMGRIMGRAVHGAAASAARPPPRRRSNNSTGGARRLLQMFHVKPEYPSVFKHTTSKSASDKACVTLLSAPRMFVTMARGRRRARQGMYSCFAGAASRRRQFLWSVRRSDEQKLPLLLTTTESVHLHKNSVFMRREDSCSPSDLRALSSESISSTKITRVRVAATTKSAQPSFALPIHLDVNEDADMEKKVAPHCDATARPIASCPCRAGQEQQTARHGARAAEQLGLEQRPHRELLHRSFGVLQTRDGTTDRLEPLQNLAHHALDDVAVHLEQVLESCSPRGEADDHPR